VRFLSSDPRVSFQTLRVIVGHTSGVPAVGAQGLKPSPACDGESVSYQTSSLLLAAFVADWSGENITMGPCVAINVDEGEIIGLDFRSIFTHPFT
jgi:hypothetical protein